MAQDMLHVITSKCISHDLHMIAHWPLEGTSSLALRTEDPRFAGIFPGRVIPVTSKLALQWLPCQAPGVIGSVLGLVGLVSVYCDWVR